jgi:hypothetical protein
LPVERCAGSAYEISNARLDAWLPVERRRLAVVCEGVLRDAAPGSPSMLTIASVCSRIQKGQLWPDGFWLADHRAKASRVDASTAYA